MAEQITRPSPAVRAGSASSGPTLFGWLATPLLAAFLVLLLGPLPAMAAPPQEAVFAGGCFWCLEHDLQIVPGVLSAINSTLAANKINILGQYLTTNDLIGYVVLDVDKKLSARAIELLKQVKETIKVRLLY
jgi:hypothetical protein